MNNIKPKRFSWFGRVASAAVLGILPLIAAAQTYPNKPVKVVIPYPPGGPTDILGRIIAQGLGAKFGQPFVVENKSGASGMIGTDLVAKAPADGYTLLVNASIHVIYPSLYSKMQFDSIKDFAPVSQIAQVPLVLVMNHDQPVKSVKDLISMAKAQPGKLQFASSGNGAAPHLAGEAFKIATGVDMLHIPYKGSAPALTDVVGGHVQLMFDSLPSSMPFITSGKLRPIAVTTSKRITSLPNVPTVAESGVPEFDISTWYGVWAPAGTPPAIVNKISAEIAAMVNDPDVGKRLAALGAEPVGSSPDNFSQYVRSEMVKFDKVVKKSGAKVD